METKTVVLLGDWEGHAKGDILKLETSVADALIAATLAKAFDPAAEKAAREKAEAERQAADAQMKALVQSAVKETVDSLTKEGGGVAYTKPRTDDDPKGGFKHFGEFAKAVHSASAPGGEIDFRLKAPTADEMQEGIGSRGGFLVPTEFRAMLLQRAYDGSAVAGRCQRLPMSSAYLQVPRIVESSRVDGSRSGGILGYWIAEMAQKTTSKPAFGQVELKLNELAVFVYVTDQLLSDSAISLEPLLTQLCADEIAFKLDDAIINGTGAGMPLGILNAPCLVTVAQVAGQGIDTVVVQNIAQMYSRMHARSRANAVWLVNQEVLYELFTMGLAVGAGGGAVNPVMLPPGGISNSPVPTLLGRPVIECEQCAQLGDVGDVIFGDFSQYLLGQKATGVDAATSIHIRFDYDETAFRFILRADGQPWWASALTPYKGAATQSPFVALITRV